ncbi:ROK family protein [Companilactobacillus alimentarius]|uniref:Transcriptional regulator n=1 Tax=Companilactobacillus alimentarius DSM 20249 TaxID=1423720 RepID=A0A2K9HRC3_9LACO|nr:ROK family protein [Companilactobacillus alimentarius]AUI72402.1 transcriptional regulator [Companilactobacillus alimentarius DSM 20249]KRK75857.1 sugar kinase and transcription regulator [Companilactobacillus alimentarius DSM 20249]MDT6952989.1 ROK family protein [Companilactobacillus alimentarius]GEO45822.1 transcriptional regulator [Companilactobacillus alimentarius]
MKKYVGLDIGGTSVKYGLVDENGVVSNKDHFETNSDDQKALLNDLTAAVKKIQAIDQDVLGIGVSMPGVVQADGFLTTSGAVKCFTGINLAQLLKERTGLPAKIENDANAAAIAEKWIGSAQGIHNYIGLVLGTGVGGALIINDQIYRGAHARSGEFGWMIVEDDDIDVEMGSLNFRGATVIGLIRRYNQFSRQRVDDARIIFQRADDGETLAKNVLKSYYHSLAKGIINLEVSFDPELVIIGGGISNNTEFLNNLNKTIEKVKATHNSIKDLDLPLVKAAKLKNDAGMIGAVYQFINA